MPASHHAYRLGDYTVDLDRACLLRDGVEVRLRPKAFEALCYLIEHRGRLATKSELITALWRDVVVTDDSLVKCIREIRRALDDENGVLIKTVPRRGYILEARVATLPGGNGQAAMPTDSVPLVPARSSAVGLGARLLLPVVAVGLAIAAAWWLFEELRGGRVLPNSVAVLPFENLSPDPDNAYFAAGIHESILNQLAQLEHVNTVARSSMLHYANRQTPIREIAEQLKVRTVMEGSVRYADGRVVVTAQLIDPATGLHLWSEEYDRPFTDIFAIQADIARRVAAAFEAELSDAERRELAEAPTRSPEAYQLYLKGRYHWDKWLPAEVRRSIDYYEQAIRIDTTFALAYTGLADSLTALNGLGVETPGEVMPRAKEAALRALQIDPELAEAHVSLGLIKHFYDWDYAGGDASFRRAIALKPNSATAHHLYGKNLPVTSPFELALAELRRALQLEPFSVGITKDLGETLYYARRYDEAIDQFERTLSLEPGYLVAYFWLVRCYEAQGRRDEAIESHLMLQRSLKGSGWADRSDESGSFAELYAASGWQAYWTAYLSRLRAASEGQFVDPYRYVELAVRAGNTEQAFHWLEKCFEMRCSWIPTIAFDPLLDSLRGHPRFTNLLRGAGLERRGGD